MPSRRGATQNVMKVPKNKSVSDTLAHIKIVINLDMATYDL